MLKRNILLVLFIVNSVNLFAQLKLGNAKTEINFREGPGINFKVVYTINKSNLLVILPRNPVNDFIEVFDIETSSYGFVAKNLIEINDSLNFGKQNFFEKSAENATGEVEIELVNLTSLSMYVWLNATSYNLAPHEKKVIVSENEEITYFSSAPGMYPVFGKEVLQKGNIYRWRFSK